MPSSATEEVGPIQFCSDRDLEPQDQADEGGHGSRRPAQPSEGEAVSVQQPAAALEPR